MKYAHLLLFASCLTLAGCPRLNLDVRTDKSIYDVNDTVTTNVTNINKETAYLNGCNPSKLYKQLPDGEELVPKDVVCIHNNANPLPSGETFSESFTIESSGTYRVDYEFGIDCTENQPVSETNCGVIVNASSDSFQVMDAQACIEIYAPVCALNSVYTTYSNECHALADGADIAFPAECGTIEGMSPPVQPEPPGICTTEYRPVCGVKGTVVSEYSNACRAEVDGALIVDDSICKL